MTDIDRNFEHLPSGEITARSLLVTHAVNRAAEAASTLIGRLEKPRDIIPAPIIEPERVLTQDDSYAGIAELGEFGAHQLAVLRAQAAVDEAYREAA